MRATKIMSIIGLVIAGFGLLCMYGFSTPEDWESAVGWGVIIAIYLTALSIVALVQARSVK